MSNSDTPRHLDIESLYWEFDARKKGYGQWKGIPQSERDAFKAVIAHVRPQIEREARAAAVRDAVLFFMPKRLIPAALNRCETLASAPPGYVCVPVEPSLDMVLAGAACEWPFRDIYEKLNNSDCQEAAKEIYKAMLTAARTK